MTKRQKPKDRKAALLAAALKHAAEVGYTHITRDGVARAAGCSDALVSAYWGTMPQLKREVIRAAIRLRYLPIIAQGIVAKDPQVLKAPSELRTAAIEQIK